MGRKRNNGLSEEKHHHCISRLMVFLKEPVQLFL